MTESQLRTRKENNSSPEREEKNNKDIGEQASTQDTRHMEMTKPDTVKEMKERLESISGHQQLLMPASTLHQKASNIQAEPPLLGVPHLRRPTASAPARPQQRGSPGIWSAACFTRRTRRDADDDEDDEDGPNIGYRQQDRDGGRGRQNIIPIEIDVGEDRTSSMEDDSDTTRGRSAAKTLRGVHAAHRDVLGSAEQTEDEGMKSIQARTRESSRASVGKVTKPHRARSRTRTRSGALVLESRSQSRSEASGRSRPRPEGRRPLQSRRTTPREESDEADTGRRWTKIREGTNEIQRIPMREVRAMAKEYTQRHRVASSAAERIKSRT